MRSTIEIIGRLWNAFHHHRPYYAVVANLIEPSADLMVISERGLGIVELKHYFGKISCRTNGFWYAGPKKMQAGVEGRGFRNPHEQVQAYAEEIRARLLKPPLWQEPWLPGKTIDWPDFKFHTAVCFTHPEADLSQFEEQMRRRCRPIVLPWEDFSVLRPDELASWTSALRFEVGGEHGEGFTRHRFSPAQIERFLTEVFEVSEWQEVYDLLPSGLPYATLMLSENDRPLQIFGLDRDTITIGRDINACDLVIPERFSLVSRVHARIVRNFDGVFLEDLHSTNGTYVGETRIHRRVVLNNQHEISLGGRKDNSEAAQLRISFEVDARADLEITRKLSLPDGKGD